MIGLLGAKIWVEARVDFGNPINLMTAAVALIIGIADFTWTLGDLQFAGIALGTVAALVGFHVMRGGQPRDPGGARPARTGRAGPLMKISSSIPHAGLMAPA